MNKTKNNVAFKEFAWFPGRFRGISAMQEPLLYTSLKLGLQSRHNIASICEGMFSRAPVIVSSLSCKSFQNLCRAMSLISGDAGAFAADRAALAVVITKANGIGSAQSWSGGR